MYVFIFLWFLWFLYPLILYIYTYIHYMYVYRNVCIYIYYVHIIWICVYVIRNIYCKIQKYYIFVCHTIGYIYQEELFFLLPYPLCLRRFGSYKPYII